MKTLVKALPRGEEFKSKLEAEYDTRLSSLKRVGQIMEYRYEPIRLKLGEGCWYKPDFMVINLDNNIEFHETKGSWKMRGQRDGRTRIKAAAHSYPYFQFIGVTKSDGVWKFEEF